MTLDVGSFILCVVAIVYAIISTCTIRSANKAVERMIENTNKFLEKMKQEDLEAGKRHEEMMKAHKEMLAEWREKDEEAKKRHEELLAEWRREQEEWRREQEERQREQEERLEQMERRHRETMERIAYLITAKSEEIKELIKT